MALQLNFHQLQELFMNLAGKHSTNSNHILASKICEKHIFVQTNGYIS